MINQFYVLLSRNNVYIGTYNQEEYDVILEHLKAYFYPIKKLGYVNVYKTDKFNATKIRDNIRKVITKNLYE